MTTTYLFDGTDVATIGRIATYEGLFEPAPLRGDDLTIPGANGVTTAERPFGVGTFTLNLVLTTAGLTARNDALRSLTQLFKPGRVVTCTRRRDYTSGTEDHTAPVRYLSGLDPSMIGVSAGRLAVAFTVLPGLWSGASVSPTIPGTITVSGDAPTSTMTITLPGAGTLTNSTTGTSITVTAGATLTVATKTTTGAISDVVASGDPLGRWFTLVPGSNVITWSGAGTPTLSYSPAYV